MWAALLGALIGGLSTAAGTILVTLIANRAEGHRHRRRLAYEGALEEWKASLAANLEAAKIRGGGRFLMPPPFITIYRALQFDELVEKGSLTPEGLRAHLDSMNRLDAVLSETKVFTDEQYARPLAVLTFDTRREAAAAANQPAQLLATGLHLRCGCGCDIDLQETIAGTGLQKEPPSVRCPRCPRGYRLLRRTEDGMRGGELSLQVKESAELWNAAPSPPSVLLGKERTLQKSASNPAREG
jgi:hypothetical protein